MSGLTTHIQDTAHGQSPVQLRRPPSDQPLLYCVVLRVELTAPDANYYVSLLLSPWNFSTYRTSSP